MASNHSDQEEAPIVDFAILEAAKENIQPLARGRRVTTLSAVLSTPHHRRDERLAATRAQLREEVETSISSSSDWRDTSSSLPNPLETYSTLVHWTVEHYPEGPGAESGILELLEEATRVLKDYEDFKQDERYLKLWQMYAGYVERPSTIYAFLMANEIGTKLAGFYESYAAALERDGRRTKADEIYQLGIARKTEPLRHLQLRYAEFQKRMLSSGSVSSSEPAAPTIAASQPAKRTILSEARVSSSSSSRAPASSASQRPTVFTDPAPSSTRSSLLSASASTSRSNARIAVFTDNAQEEDAGAQGDENRTPYPELGTRATRTKENVRTKSKAGGTSLKQKISTRPPVTKMAIFVDPDPSEGVAATEETSPTPVTKPTNAAVKLPLKPAFVPFVDISADNELQMSESRQEHDKNVMKPKSSTVLTETEALKKDPFKNYDVRPVESDD